MNSPSLALLLAILISAGSSLSSCGTRTPRPLPSPSASASASPSTAPVAKYSYDMPLKVRAEPECEGASQLLYQVNPDGSFRYYPGDYNPFSEEATKTMQQRTLSDAELEDLKSLLKSIDLAKKFESSTKIPEDAPRTLECRTVTTYTLAVDGQDRTFDANGRVYQHTQAYRDAIAQLAQKLKALASGSVSAQPVHYGLPLKMYQYFECDKSSRVEYEVLATGELRTLRSDSESATEYKTRTLGRLEIKELDDLLSRLDLYNQFLKQEKIPADAPQTEECRTIEKLDLDVDSRTQTLDGSNSRSIKPDTTYLQQINELRAKLRELGEE
ncbi:MAG: hypothetical protein ACAI44_02915 [Candidatus Sericytochromatia bacterium]